MHARLSPKLYPFSETRNPQRPSHLGIRYDMEGNFLPEAGNTVVCHLEPEGETMSALVDARNRYVTMPDARRLAVTPIESLHMTLFQGVVEYRRKPNYWPADIPADAAIDTVTEELVRRLSSVEPGPRFRTRVVEALPTGLTVEGETAADRQAMRLWRDRLADVFGYRHPDHGDYVFHVTFAYPITRFDDEALLAWQQMLFEVAADIAARAPVLALKPPAFCRFADMCRFEEILVLPFDH